MATVELFAQYGDVTRVTLYDEYGVEVNTLFRKIKQPLQLEGRMDAARIYTNMAFRIYADAVDSTAEDILPSIY